MIMFIQTCAAFWAVCSAIAAAALITILIKDKSAGKNALFVTVIQGILSLLGFVLTVALGPIFLGYMFGCVVIGAKNAKLK